jgi:hypothetical protein
VQSLFNRQNGNRAHSLASLMRATVLEGNFWHRCQNYVHMVEDVLKALRVFDGREPAMGRAWLTMNNLKKHIFNLRNPPFNLPVRIATTGDGYCASVERGAGSGEQGFLILILKNSDNHGKGDLLPWMKNI